jgi:diguanylate cyclase (GGDEF)-like protein
MKPRWLARWHRTTLPGDVYASHVDALYSDAASLTIGVLAAFLTTLSTGILIGNASIIAIAVVLALLGLVRLASMRQFWARRLTLNEDTLPAWDKGYVLGGTLHLALLGLFCWITFTRTSDDFARLASLSITMAYLIGTPGRSFASDLLVDAQILVTALPLTAAMALAGARYWIIVLFVLLPFFFALKTISARLRGIFQSAVLRARDLSVMAGRFDTALTNMPHGLAMFEANGHVTVANARFGTLLGVTQGEVLHQPMVSLLSSIPALGTGRGAPATALQLTEWARSGRRTAWTSKRPDDRSITFTLQGMDNGGGVITAEDVTERVQAEATLAFLARFDKLTGLPNRHNFQEAVAQRLQEVTGRSGALMFIDLDRFKGINDTLGHAMGDQLLRAVAERLRSSTHPRTLMARFGGDEFVLFRHFTSVREDAGKLAATIIARLSEPFELDGHQLVIGATIGIAEAHAGDAVDDLLRDADLALYRAKAAGRGSFEFFAGEMQAVAVARRELETDLRAAVERGQLALDYQPMVDIESGACTTCEALLRWQHPTRGAVAPPEFIAIAEDTGIITDLGAWVLREACRECARWPESVAVAVNVSALQFRRGDLAEIAMGAVSAAGINPARLEIEITETALLHDLDDARAMLQRLQNCGMRLALDDFGTGYSSLSYLQLLPFDKLKLDRSFLGGIGEDGRGLRVLRGIARLSADLGMSVVMEGVETLDQLAAILGSGVQEVQGYLVSRPVPPAALRPLLAGRLYTPWVRSDGEEQLTHVVNYA